MSQDDEHLRRVAWWLDSAIRLPGTQIRVGVDSIVGLVPGIGDALGVLLSSYLIREGVRRGLPRRKIGRMLGNVMLEAVLGVIPIVGDLFDVVWRANRRNVEILLENGPRPADEEETPRTPGSPSGIWIRLLLTAGAALGLGWGVWWVAASVG